MEEVTDFCKDSDEAIPIVESNFNIPDGQMRFFVAKKVCNVNVQWKSGFNNWVTLSPINDPNPVKLTEQ